MKERRDARPRINFGVVVRGTVSDIEKLAAFLEQESSLQVIYCRTSSKHIFVVDQEDKGGVGQ